MDKDKLDHNIGFLVTDISRLITTEYNRMMKPLGLTRAQWRLIIFLHREDGLTQSELARLLEVGKVSMGGLIDRLEHSGWIERRSDPRDRRNNLIHLTSKGREIEPAMISTANKLGEKTFKNLDDDERALLVHLLIAVKDNLQEVDNFKVESDDEPDPEFHALDLHHGVDRDTTAR
jgi:MarR family transcriptional regulator for hemolysin